MVSVILRFVSGRYHGTPWGHHANEGLIEWPPSPWRLLRALISTGYTAGLWNGDGLPALARSLVTRLSGAPPRYRLPHVTGAHSRHYMPLARFKNNREETTLVFDTWANIAGDALGITWDIDLPADERQLLEDLVARLGYLGRSESWVLGRVAPQGEGLPPGFDCVPCDQQTMSSPGWEQIALLACVPSQEYDAWRVSKVEEATRHLPSVDATKKRLSREERKALQQRERAVDAYPEDLLACLQKDTRWLQEHGWSQPPGARRILYWRKAGILEAGAPPLQRGRTGGQPVDVMLLAMATASGNDHALPACCRTLPQAELLHRALVSIATRDGRNAPSLTGRDDQRIPLEGHGHAHILPVDLDGDGHLDHILLWAPLGLDARAQTAVRTIRQTFTKGGIGPLRLALVGAGAIEDVSKLPGAQGRALERILGFRDQGSAEWESVTPFVPPRHVKKRGRHTLEGQIAEELAARGFPPLHDILLIDPHEEVIAARHRHFVRSRRMGPPPPVDCSFSLRIRLSEPARGPVCLGYGSHYGLGLFQTVVSENNCGAPTHERTRGNELEET